MNDSSPKIGRVGVLERSIVNEYFGSLTSTVGNKSVEQLIAAMLDFAVGAGHGEGTGEALDRDHNQDGYGCH